MIRNEYSKELISSLSGPIIGFIGATMPEIGYDREFTKSIGYELRGNTHSKGGTLFTGGVCGVGLHAYRGIAKYCIDNNLKDDGFFVMIPKNVHVPRIDAFGIPDYNDIRVVPYSPPKRYESYAEMISENGLKVITAGEDMAGRRDILARTGDIFVMINGGLGTLEESFFALDGGKQVITMPDTGGTARLLADIAQGACLDLTYLHRRGIDPPNLTEDKRKQILIATDAKQVIDFIDGIGK